jgi:riboflavin kinase/FMN adenylyltransferase
MDDAVELLGHPYRLTGTVGAGAQRGRQIGFPTANLVDVLTVIPGPGVYGAKAEVNGARYLAAVNIGPNPTFDEAQPKLEANLLDFHGDLYGQRLSVDLTYRIRAVQKFPSIEALRAQLIQDANLIRQRQ